MTSLLDLGRRFGIPASVFTLAALVVCGNVHGQDITRRQLEHSDYDRWNSLSGARLSNDGSWILYTLQSGEIDGEATLHIQQAKTGREYTIERGTGAKITSDNRYAIYRITPEKKKVKQLRKQKKKPEEMPLAILQILELESGDLQTIHGVRSFGVPEENGDWVACLMEKSHDADEIDKSAAADREVYQVTPEGLRRPKQKLKLKSREEVARQRASIAANVKTATEEKESKGQATKEESDGDKDEQDKKDKPVGTPLKLINLDTKVLRAFPSVRSFRFAKNGKRLAFVTSVEMPEKNKSNKVAKASKASQSSQTEEQQHNAKQNASSDSVNKQRKELGPVDSVHVLELDSLDQHTILSGVGEYKSLAFNEDASRLAFISNKDDYESKTPSWDLYLWKAGAKLAKRIVAESDQAIPSQWWISPQSSQDFSQDGRRLYFDTSPIPDAVLKQRRAKAEGRDVKDDEDNEKAKLDIWHWQDPKLQPQQLLEAGRERNRRYRAAYVLKSKKTVQLEDSELPTVRVDSRSPATIAVANTDVPYRKTLSWEVPGFQDVYLVNLNSGRRERVLEKVRWDASLSPKGKFLYWFDAVQQKWFAKSTKGKDADTIEISQGIKHPLYNELDDRPTLPSAYGSAGWMDNDEALLIYDSHDIWKLHPTGNAKPVCLTLGEGRKNDIRFRYQRLDSKQRSIAPSSSLILNAFDRGTKASGFYALNLASKTDTKDKPDNKTKSSNEALRSLIMLDEDLSGLRKAKDSDRVMFSRSTFREYPDLWTSTTKFQEIRRVSDANPQQDEYSWGTAELTHWKAKDGQDLDGILLKPDNFDPSKQYPMLVYFYERKSDSLHSYYPPQAGRSTICFSFYVSRGYLVFIPDIPYKTGEPGQSAVNSILPGVDHLVAQGFVDNDRVGMQGHSWGGYQTAYLVTQTDRFACAESGAPVSNMTSAYGGIRWSTGMSRMFQYERTQSRIGEDLWSARDKYIANSPLFFADKISTPLLILHNDHDGAVPWYQGIELFVALRRLEKPAWMLNYNGDPHWVMGDYNRRDFAIRMQQFFDHYLMDAPEPEWMAVGVPAVEKGENDGLELLEPASPAPTQE
ncbi:Prolyl oligopeptidase family protein [Neorhodopirellula lusitana]|uniref:Prolyl oligopeptidase family protein n=1 Tax=Neorhodopirellula lusitana TaxID=445327 RepID=A0ABY1QCL2_9BACT|nr:prolyl oligopeptidase family serine peptidase [Neorhodopirellula lusitana]SMP67357.1 Prolyl oligopeptidase family protein [Neorhodopirellula lusitana]